VLRNLILPLCFSKANQRKLSASHDAPPAEAVAASTEIVETDLEKAKTEKRKKIEAEVALRRVKQKEQEEQKAAEERKKKEEEEEEHAAKKKAEEDRSKLEEVAKKKAEEAKKTAEEEKKRKDEEGLAKKKAEEQKKSDDEKKRALQEEQERRREEELAIAKRNAEEEAKKKKREEDAAKVAETDVKEPDQMVAVYLLPKGKEDETDATVIPLDNQKHKLGVVCCFDLLCFCDNLRKIS
jgi:hypothetical protein